MGARDVFVVRQQLKKKIGLMALGTERKGADRRDTVVPLIDGMNRVSPRGAKVRRRVGVSWKPDSSANTRCTGVVSACFF